MEHDARYFSWFELRTTDCDSARAFYESVLGANAVATYDRS